MSHPEKIGKYEIVSVLGRGGMGVVYKARDPYIDRVVAIKTIRMTPEMEDEDLGARLEMEAKSAGRLHHPNICTVFDFGVQEELSFIVLEYAEGGDLSQVIDKKLPLSLPQKIDIITQIAHGLDYAHSLGVVHRDMKPANVRLTREGVAKIIDFGLARFDTTRLTKTGFMSGTIAYMSPERINGETGKSDDIFALGTLAWELLTYERAFPGSAPPEVMLKILSASPAPPSTVIEAPRELDEIILKGMARDKSERYQTAGDLAYDLEDLVRSEEFRSFLTSEDRSEGFQEALKGWEESFSGDGRSSDSRIRKRTGRALSTTISSRLQEPDHGTVIERAPESSQEDATAVVSSSSEPAPTVVEPHHGAAGEGGDLVESSSPTIIDTAVPVMDPTVMRERPRSRKGLLVGLLIAVVATVATGLGLTMLNQEAQPDPVEVVPTDPEGEREEAMNVAAAPIEEAQIEEEGPDVAAMIAWESELRMVERLRSQIPERDLNASERSTLRQLNEMENRARSEFDAGEIDQAVLTLAGAGEEIESLLTSYNGRKRAEAIDEARRIAQASNPPTRTSEPARVSPRRPEREAPVSEPVAAPTEPSAPARVEPAGPTPAQMREEVANFVQRLARAYEERDVRFFETRFDGFNSAIERAIENSPSSRVRIEIDSIALDGERGARVEVERTDTFPDGNIPSAVQRLSYDLRRAGDGWHLVSFSRR